MGKQIPTQIRNVANITEEIKDGVMGSYLRPRIVYALEGLNDNDEKLSMDIINNSGQISLTENLNKANTEIIKIMTTKTNNTSATLEVSEENIQINKEKDEETAREIKVLQDEEAPMWKALEDLIEDDHELRDSIEDSLSDGERMKNDIDEFINMVNGQNVVETGYFKKTYISDSRKGVCRNTTIKGSSIQNVLDRTLSRYIVLSKASGMRTLKVPLEVPLKKGTNFTFIVDVTMSNATKDIQLALMDKNGVAIHWPVVDHTKDSGRQYINYNIGKDDVYYVYINMGSDEYEAGKIVKLEHLKMVIGTYNENNWDNETDIRNIRMVGDSGVLTINSSNKVVCDETEVQNNVTFNVSMSADIKQQPGNDVNYINKRSLSKVIDTYNTQVLIECGSEFQTYIVGADQSGRINKHEGWNQQPKVWNEPGRYIRIYLSKRDGSDIKPDEKTGLKVTLGKVSTPSNNVNSDINILMPNSFGMPGISQNGEVNLDDNLCDSIIQESKTGKIYYANRIKRFVIDSYYDWEISPTWTTSDMIFFKCKTVNGLSPYPHKYLCDKIFVPVRHLNEDLIYCRDHQLEAIVQSQNQWGAGVEFALYIKRSRLSAPTVDALKEFLRTRYNIVVYAKRNTMIMYEMSDPKHPEYINTIDPISYDGGTLITSKETIKPSVNTKIPKNVQTMLTKDMMISNQVNTQQGELSNSIGSIETRLYDNIKLRQLQNDLVNERMLNIERR